MVDEDGAMANGSGRGAAVGVVIGLAATVLLLVLLFVPVIVMLRLPPSGTPTPLPDALGLALYLAAGAVLGVLFRLLRTRLVAMVTVSAVVLFATVWFHHGAALPLPVPPTLPLLPGSLVVLAGILLGALVVSLRGRSSVGGPGDAGPFPARALVAGVVVAALVVGLTEFIVWGSERYRVTFELPFGLSLGVWREARFLLTLVVAGAVGWLATTRSHRPVGAALGAMLVLLVAVLISVSTGLSGPPRLANYGLSIGVLATASLLAPRGPTG